MAVGQNRFGIPFWGRCTIHFRTYFSGDWDVHWGYDLDLDPQPCFLVAGLSWGMREAGGASAGARTRRVHPSRAQRSARSEKKQRLGNGP